LFTIDIFISILVGAFILALILIPISTKLAWKLGAIDHPTARGSHHQPVSRLGGLGVVFALMITLLVFLPIDSLLFSFLSGLLAIAVIGVIDDIWRISAKIKFAGQILAALIFIYSGGGVIENLGDLFAIGEIDLNWMALPFTVLVMVGGMNAINLSDGLDGLASGMALIAAMFLAIFAWHVGSQDVVVITIALCGAILGFLRFNTYPAKLFMGDVGSLSLGFCLAALLIFLSNQTSEKIQLILDTLLVMGRRIYNRQNPFSADRTHLHHRLLSLNLPHSLVVTVMYLLMAAFGLLAIIIHSQPAYIQLLSLLGFGGSIFATIIYAQYRGFDWKKYHEVFVRQGLSSEHRITQFSIHYGNLINRLLLVIFILPAIWLTKINEITGHLPVILAGLLTLVIWSHRKEFERILVGSAYLAIFVLLFEFNNSAQLNHFYGYALWLTATITMVWVAYKIVYYRRTKILFTTGFELILLMLVWFIPFIAVPFLGLGTETEQQALRSACLQSLPIFLLVKLHFSRDSGSHFVVIGGLAALLTLVWLRGHFGF
jgi:UDP-GlcNAc:undecaprenyl-phosphate GlcNAc-1-phosphate transferase